ncbi:MAG: ice-binding family protein [Gemmatimonadales bacterium]
MKRFTILLASLGVLAAACNSSGSTGVSGINGPAAVNLGTAGNFAILAKSGISTTGVTAVVGNVGLSPAAGSFVTGFSLTSDVSNTFATSAMVTGKVWAADYTAPTPTNLTTAVLDMQTAYTDAAGRTSPNVTELGAGNIQGLTLTPGLYKWGTGVSIPSAVTLSGGANAVWIFQIAQDLTVGNAAIVTLAGGAQAKNVFWQVAGQVTLGTTSDFKGVILSQTAIAMNTGAVVTGRALAQTAVTLDATTITQP